MKNAILSIVTFFVLLISIFFLQNSLITYCNTIEEKSNIIESFLNNDDIENAYKHSLELQKYLSNGNNLNLIYVNHQDFDTVKYEASRLSTYILNNDTEAFASLCVIKTEVKTIANLQKIQINNIL